MNEYGKNMPELLEKIRSLKETVLELEEIVEKRIAEDNSEATDGSFSVDKCDSVISKLDANISTIKQIIRKQRDKAKKTTTRTEGNGLISSSKRNNTESNGRDSPDLFNDTDTGVQSPSAIENRSQALEDDQDDADTNIPGNELLNLETESRGSNKENSTDDDTEIAPEVDGNKSEVVDQVEDTESAEASNTDRKSVSAEVDEDNSKSRSKAKKKRRVNEDHEDVGEDKEKDDAVASSTDVGKITTSKPFIKVIDIKKFTYNESSSSAPPSTEVTPKKKTVTFDASVIILSSEGEQDDKGGRRGKNTKKNKVSKLKEEPHSDGSDMDKENSGKRKRKTEKKRTRREDSSDDDVAEKNSRKRLRSKRSSTDDKSSKKGQKRSRIIVISESSDENSSEEESEKGKRKGANKNESNTSKSTRKAFKNDELKKVDLPSDSDNEDGDRASKSRSRPKPKSRRHKKASHDTVYADTAWNDDIKFKSKAYVYMIRYPCDKLKKYYKDRRDLLEIKRLIKTSTLKRKRGAQDKQLPSTMKSSSDSDKPMPKRKLEEKLKNASKKMVSSGSDSESENVVQENVSDSTENIVRLAEAEKETLRTKEFDAKDEMASAILAKLNSPEHNDELMEVEEETTDVKKKSKSKDKKKGALGKKKKGKESRKSKGHDAEDSDASVGSNTSHHSNSKSKSVKEPESKKASPGSNEGDITETVDSKSTKKNSDEATEEKVIDGDIENDVVDQNTSIDTQEGNGSQSECEDDSNLESKQKEKTIDGEEANEKDENNAKNMDDDSKVEKNDSGKEKSKEGDESDIDESDQRNKEQESLAEENSESNDEENIDESKKKKGEERDENKSEADKNPGNTEESNDHAEQNSESESEKNDSHNEENTDLALKNKVKRSKQKDKTCEGNKEDGPENEEKSDSEPDNGDKEKAAPINDEDESNSEEPDNKGANKHDKDSESENDEKSQSDSETDSKKPADEKTKESENKESDSEQKSDSEESGKKAKTNERSGEITLENEGNLDSDLDDQKKSEHIDKDNSVSEKNTSENDKDPDSELESENESKKSKQKGSCKETKDESDGEPDPENDDGDSKSDSKNIENKEKKEQERSEKKADEGEEKSGSEKDGGDSDSDGNKDHEETNGRQPSSEENSDSEKDRSKKKKKKKAVSSEDESDSEKDKSKKKKKKAMSSEEESDSEKDKSRKKKKKAMSSEDESDSEKDKSNKKMKKIVISSDENSDEGRKNGKDSTSESDSKNRDRGKWRRDKLLTEKLSSADSDDEFEKFQKKKERDRQKVISESEDDIKKEKKKRKVKKRALVVISDSDSNDCWKKSSSNSSSDSSSDSEKEEKKKDVELEKPKRTRIRRLKETSSEDEDEKSTRKNIRRVWAKDSLSETTKQAEADEKARKARIAEKQKKYNNIYTLSSKTDAKVDKLVLDFNEETEEELLAVDKKLVEKLKPHQASGIQFIWDACFESLDRAKKTEGSGCILAHCMGLGKTLQVVALTHTLLVNEEQTGVKKVLVVCPLSTVLNWVAEYKKWMPDEDDVEVYELVSCKPNDRQYEVKNWNNTGGIMIIGYNMFRTLTNPDNKRVNKKVRNLFETALVNPGPDMVVCDEGHLLKNEKSHLSIAMNRLRTMRRIVLTGTPLQNNLKEYYCMVHFIKPSLLGTYKEYLNRFVNPITNGQYTDSTPHDIQLMRKRSHVLHKLLDGVVQRRDYAVLAPYLPQKHEYVLFLSLTDLQEKLYGHYINNLARHGDSAANQAGRTFLFVDFQELQGICSHPRILVDKKVDKEVKDMFMEDDDSEGSLKDFIVDKESSSESTPNSSSDESDAENKKSGGSSDESKPSKKAPRTRVTRAAAAQAKDTDFIDLDSVQESTRATGWWTQYCKDGDLESINNSTKLLLLFNILKECEQIGDKVLIFSQSLYSLSVIEYFLAKIDEATQEGSDLDGFTGSWALGLDYFRLDGSSSCSSRSSWCNTFNDPSNTRARLFLISTRAGGLGINLVAANRVIIFDVSWNPSHDIQSIYRVYRFGQTKPCYVYRFVTYGTMEMKIYERQVTKQAISKRVIDEQQIDRHYNQNDLAELYRFEPIMEDRPTPLVPKDVLLGELLQKFDKEIWTYHEHQSLLENKEDEELDEEERKAAWEEFENEKVMRKYSQPNPNLGGFVMTPEQITQALTNIIKRDNPGWNDQQVRAMMPTLVKELEAQMEIGNLNLYNKIQREVQMMNMLQAQKIRENWMKMQMMRTQQNIMNNANLTPQQKQAQFQQLLYNQWKNSQQFNNPQFNANQFNTPPFNNTFPTMRTPNFPHNPNEIIDLND